jgi:hypothetical protein
MGSHRTSDRWLNAMKYRVVIEALADDVVTAVMKPSRVVVKNKNRKMIATQKS